MSRLKILHVDDDPDIREVAALSFDLDGAIDVLSAPSGPQALAALAEGFAPDVILLDVMMPGMDGPSTLEAVRRLPAQAATPVIFMTARAQDHEQSRFLDLGAIGVITKPFDPMTLAADVRGRLARAG